MSSLTDQEMAAAIAYAEGHLTDDEQIEFELRMTEDSELARAVEELADSYPFIERLARQREDNRGHRPRWAALILASAAAAGIALVFRLAIGPSSDTAEPLSARVAVVEAAATGESFAISLGLPSTIPWVGPSSRGGNASGTEAVMPASEFMRRAEQALGEARVEALDTPPASVRSDFFRVLIDLPETSSVVICSVPDSSSGELPGLTDSAQERASRGYILFPVGRNPDAARLAAGVHSLPRDPVVLITTGEEMGVEYDRGFVRRRSQARINVVVAVRADALDASSLQSIEEACASGASQLSATLKELGFSLTEHSVRE